MAVFGLMFGVGSVPKLYGDEITPTKTRFDFGTSGITMNANAHLVTKSDKRVRNAVEAVLGVGVSGVLREMQTDWRSIGIGIIGIGIKSRSGSRF